MARRLNAESKFDVVESILYDLEKEFDEMILDQEDEEGHGGHNNISSNSFSRSYKILSSTSSTYTTEGVKVEIMLSSPDFFLYIYFCSESGMDLAKSFLIILDIFKF